MQKKQVISKRSKYINSLFSRSLLSVIMVLASVIFVKHSNSNLLMYKEHVFEKSFQFATVNKLYKKYLGSILPFDKISQSQTQAVFDESFTYKETSKNLDGTKFIVSQNYLMPALQSGIFVFIGQKQDYGDTIIIQGTDGVDIWYSNISTTLKLYDYVEKDTLVGEVKEDNITLVLQKDNEYIDYSEYEKSNQD